MDERKRAKVPPPDPNGRLSDQDIADALANAGKPTPPLSASERANVLNNMLAENARLLAKETRAKGEPAPSPTSSVGDAIDRKGKSSNIHIGRNARESVVIDTEGGSVVSGNIDVTDGNFVERNKYTITSPTIVDKSRLLITSIIKRLINREDIKPSIAGVLQRKKSEGTIRACALLLALLTVYLLLAVVQLISFNIITLLVITAFLGVIYLNDQILAYRIRKGYYATNYYEANELAQFILSHPRKSDFGGPDGTYKLMPDPQPEPNQSTTTNAIGATS